MIVGDCRDTPPMMLAALMLCATLAPPSVDQAPRDGSGMVVGGSVAFGVGYGSSVLAGAVQLGEGKRPGDRTMGWRLMLPIAGPFVAMPTMSPVQRWGSAVGGALQVGGAVTLGWGLLRRGRARRGITRPFLVDRRSRLGLAAFVGVYGATYLFSSMLAAMTLNEAERTERIGRDDPSEQRRYGRRLLIPLVGPFLAIEHGPELVDRVLAGYLGAMQAMTLTGLVVGSAIVATRSRRTSPHLTMWPSLTPSGGAVQFAGRF